MRLSGTPFDIAGYLYGKGGKFSSGTHGPQVTMACPWCSKVGGFYISLEDNDHDGEHYPAGTHVCFKCGKKSRQFIFLYMELEGLSYKEARVELTKQRAGHLGRALPRPKPAPPPIEATTGSIHPDGFKPCWDEAAGKYRMPKYLTHRGITKDTARAFGLGWVEQGTYSNRVAIPVVCPVGSGFTTRTMDPEEQLRFLSGPGVGHMLFGWPQAENAKELVVAEGPFDTMSVYQAAFTAPEMELGAVGILGKKLRAAQIKMIRSHKARRIVLMLDGDALDDALDQYKQLGSRVVVAGLLEPALPGDHPDQLDPGDCSQQPERILDAIERAQEPEIVRVQRLREKVLKVAQRFKRA
jgi:hypothetical protein